MAIEGVALEDVLQVRVEQAFSGNVGDAAKHLERRIELK